MKLIALDGTVWDAVPVSENDLRGDGTCMGCGQALGEPHIECDHERCARCGGQAICCDCTFEATPNYEVADALGVITNLVRAIRAVLQKEAE